MAPKKGKGERKRNYSEQPRDASPPKKNHCPAKTGPSSSNDKATEEYTEDIAKEIKKILIVINKDIKSVKSKSQEDANFIVKTLGEVLTEQASSQKEILKTVTSLDKDAKDILSLLKKK